MKSIYFLSVLIFVFSSNVFAERWTVSVDKCNVRSGPGENFDVIWQVEKYYPIDIIESKGKWRFFRDAEGDEGWIHADLIEKVKSVVIKKDRCNIRSGPGPKFNITFVAEKGIPFKVVDRKKQWIQIEHADGDKGWVHESLVW